jgi:hypothetical protein
MVEAATRLEDCITLRELHGIVLETKFKNSVHNILLTEYLTKEWGLPTRQVLLAGDGYTWVSLDYRDTHRPSVIWLDAECERERS